MCFAKGDTDRLSYHIGYRSKLPLPLSSTKNHATGQYISSETDHLMTSSEEVNHAECKAEYIIHHYVARLTKSPDDSLEHDGAALCKPKCCVGSLVLETAQADNYTVDCSEEELVYKADEISTSATRCYINWSTGETDYSKEETSLNGNKYFNATSQQRTTPCNNPDFSINEEPASKDIRAFLSDDDGTSRNESTFGALSHDRRIYKYSDYSFKAKIVGNSELAGSHCTSDGPRKPDNHQWTSIHSSVIDSQVKPNGSVKTVADDTNLQQPCKHAIDGHQNENTCTSQRVIGYTKRVYPVLVGNSVKVYSTNLFASLPQYDKFLVKERQHDPNTGFTRAKLVLKSSVTDSEVERNLRSSHIRPNDHLPIPYDNDNDDDDDNDDVTSAYYRQNCKSPGRILYTRDRRFDGRIKYPLPNGKAVNTRIGKGGNGFVFTMYHDRKQYAVKKTVYRSNEINVHSALKHKNILPLLAVLMGEKHEHHHGKFYCFHFMPQMDYDLRQILSSKGVGCMKYFYRSCSKEPIRWEKGFNNIKFVLAETLEALAYLHSNGYVHRDVKASNIMIKMRCHCRPLECTCSTKFQVKLGDFDSAGTVPGLGITEPTDQVIKFASILPLGTPGYRAPEVSMHIVLSGPYETLYTTAVDMWSFGCLLLNICIGKTAALKQREEASLLLSRTHTCSRELWEKTTKINELKKTRPFSNEPELARLVGCCLQVNSANRPTAKEAIKMLHSLMK